MTTLRDVIGVLDRLYEPSWAESWDAVGLVSGDPDAVVEKVLFAVDPVQAVADEAVAMAADLIVVHHPLYLSGVTTVAATTPKGRVLHTLASHGIALHTCHTNADSPAHGVSESMAFALGLHDAKPLAADAGTDADKWIVFVPDGHLGTVRSALWNAGAGRIGNYDSAGFLSTGTGTFRPLDGARPAIGSVGDFEEVTETRLEVIAPRRLRETVRTALLAAHPYEEPAYDVLETAASPAERGSGRIGTLPAPMSLRQFAERVARSLPQHSGATRVAGDLDREVRVVAVCGGSGDFLLDRATAAGADVYVTSDLKHHPVSEHLEDPSACALIDVPHWAAEWTWLPVVQDLLTAELPSLQTRVSRVVTDPWSATLSGTVGV